MVSKVPGSAEVARGVPKLRGTVRAMAQWHNAQEEEINPQYSRQVIIFAPAVCVKCSAERSAPTPSQFKAMKDIIWLRLICVEIHREEAIEQGRM